MKLHERLKERALRFLKEAEEDLAKGWHDFAAFHAEQAPQLYLKALLTRFYGEPPRTHEIRKLFGELLNLLKNVGRDDLAKEIETFVKENRDALVALEEAYFASRYVDLDAEEALRVTREGVKLLKRVEAEAWPAP